MTRRPLVIANLKMNTDLTQATSLAESANQAALAAHGRTEVGFAPPYPWIVPIAVRDSFNTLLLGSEDLSAEPNGARTGEVSAEMLASYISFAIVGHSERRMYHGETDEVVNRKAQRAIRAGINPLICVGESLAVREQGNAEAFVLESLTVSIAGLDLTRILGIAYEPVWAIGTGRAATADDAETMTSALRASLPENFQQTVRILYGGSVTPDNAASLIAQPNVDGLLVGSASLDAAKFRGIIEAV